MSGFTRGVSWGSPPSPVPELDPLVLPLDPLDPELLDVPLELPDVLLPELLPELVLPDEPLLDPPELPLELPDDVPLDPLLVPPEPLLDVPLSPLCPLSPQAIAAARARKINAETRYAVMVTASIFEEWPRRTLSEATPWGRKRPGLSSGQYFFPRAHFPRQVDW
jgi:hypothetical protein